MRALSTGNHLGFMARMSFHGCLLLLGVAAALAAGPQLQTINGALLLVVPEGANVSVSFSGAQGLSPPQALATLNDILSVARQTQAEMSAMNASFLASLSSQNVLLAAQSSLVSAQSSQISSLSAQLGLEASRALRAESSLSTSIGGVTASSSSSLTSETSRAVTLESSLSLSLASEVSATLFRDASLAAAQSSAAGVLSSAVGSERSRALAAETSLGGSAADGLSRAAATASAITASVAQETSRAALAEASLGVALGSVSASLSASLSGAAASLSASISGVSSALTVSVASMSSSLSTTIAAQTSRAMAVELSLATALGTEVSRASTADVSLATSASAITAALSLAVVAERSRALAAELQEVSRAQLVEGSLSSNLSALTTEVSRVASVENSMSVSLALEISRAKAVEAFLNTSMLLRSTTFYGTCNQLLQQRPGAASGLYDMVLPGFGTQLKVYCDMTTMGGGWTLIAQTVAAVNAAADGTGGVRNLYNLRTGGGLYSVSPRGAENWAFPNAYTVAQASTTMMIARWTTPTSGLGDIGTADAGAYFTIPDPSVVTFANPSYKLSSGSTALTGPCVAVTVTSIKSGACAAGCPRYTFKFSLGTTWLDSYPTNVGVSVSSNCYNDVTGGPALASDDSGSYNAAYVGSWGKTSVAGGSPYYWYNGLWDAGSVGYAGLGTVWLR